MAARACWRPCPPRTAVSRFSAAGLAKSGTSSTRFAKQEAVKQGLHAVALDRAKARSAARRFAACRGDACSKAVACLCNDLLLTCFQYRDPDQRRQVRTTNAAPLPRDPATNRGPFQEKTSMNRIMFAIFVHENKRQGVPTLFPLTS